jgi:hypothetical protein
VNRATRFEQRHEHGYELSTIWHDGTLIAVPHAEPELVAAVTAAVLAALLAGLERDAA